ncbi:hypothetical protein VaNZ11_008003 [Volvox africanus]|uniref:Peptidase S8/S53 domain-containing protein n=1 Tax=Volvox africanus TaxID=51714 RepID=A0ABQ5S553_9CHLO|nr:hypothetical protein VaNZ11_007854 [Volvox africanus]GLI64701.1 hypothetical protein VaNZ11_008003 [Volvox africanus]
MAGKVSITSNWQCRPCCSTKDCHRGRPDGNGCGTNATAGTSNTPATWRHQRGGDTWPIPAAKIEDLLLTKAVYAPRHKFFTGLNRPEEGYKSPAGRTALDLLKTVCQSVWRERAHLHGVAGEGAGAPTTMTTSQLQGASWPATSVSIRRPSRQETDGGDPRRGQRNGDWAGRNPATTLSVAAAIIDSGVFDVGGHSGSAAALADSGTAVVAVASIFTRQE